MTDRIPAAEFRSVRSGEGTKRVQGAQPTVIDGIRFDSKREASRWRELCMLQLAGDISELERQVKVPLEGADGPILTDGGNQQRSYVADFRYFDRKLGVWVYEDAKGHPTDIYKLKRAIVAAMGIEIVEV